MTNLCKCGHTRDWHMPDCQKEACTCKRFRAVADDDGATPDTTTTIQLLRTSDIGTLEPVPTPDTSCPTPEPGASTSDSSPPSCPDTSSTFDAGGGSGGGGGADSTF